MAKYVHCTAISFFCRDHNGSRNFSSVKKYVAVLAINIVIVFCSCASHFSELLCLNAYAVVLRVYFTGDPSVSVRGHMVESEPCSACSAQIRAVFCLFCLFCFDPEPRSACSAPSHIHKPHSVLAAQAPFATMVTTETLCVCDYDLLKVKPKSTALPLLAGLVGCALKVKRSSEKSHEKIKFNPSLSQPIANWELFRFESNSNLTLEITFFLKSQSCRRTNQQKVLIQLSGLADGLPCGEPWALLVMGDPK